MYVPSPARESNRTKIFLGMPCEDICIVVCKKAFEAKSRGRTLQQKNEKLKISSIWKIKSTSRWLSNWFFYIFHAYEKKSISDEKKT